MLDLRDGLNARAMRLTSSLFGEAVRPVTTDAVVIELGNYFSATALRIEAGEWMAAIRQDSQWQIVGIDRATLAAAEARCRRYGHKDWSMTDCISMEVMERRRIREVATSDRGFAQAGFTVLMV